MLSNRKKEIVYGKYEREVALAKQFFKYLGVYGLLASGLRSLEKRIIKPPLFRSELVKLPMANFLINWFGGNIGQETDANSGFLGFGLLHYTLINLLKPDRILCIGSQKGYIPAVCAMACRDNGKGIVDFVDAGKNEHESNSWGGIGFWKKTSPKKHFSLADIEMYINTYVMDSEQFAEASKKTYGYIYIDGDHSFKGVSRDYSMFWPKLEKGGIMCFHDITLKGKANSGEYGVWKLWKQLETKHNHKISIILRQNGIGILQKK